MQMVAIFRLIQKFGWWITLFGCITITNYSFCVIIIVLFVNQKNNFIMEISISYVSHVYCFVLFIVLKQK